MKIDPEVMGVVREIARRVVSVKLPIGLMKTHQRMTGSRLSIHRGDGDNFDGHDIYVPGEDDPRTIDWNATALTGGQQILVALFKEDAHIKSSILCDVSPPMDFGSTRVTKRVLAAELSACAVRSLANTHEPVSIVTYSHSGVERRVPSSSASSMMLPTIVHVLDSRHTPRPGKTDGLGKALALVSRSPSIVFVISDFLSTTEADWQSLKRIGRRHRLICFYVQDQRERELPRVLFPVLYTVQDTSGVAQDLWVTRGRARRHKQKFEAHEARILKRLKECRATSIVVSTQEGDKASARVLSLLQSPVQ